MALPDSVLITSLAINQTHFFAGVAEALKEKGVRVGFAVFHERSEDYLKDKGFEVFNVFQVIRDLNLSKTVATDSWEKALSEFQIDNPNRYLSHEKFSFELENWDHVRNKMYRYLRAMDRIIRVFRKPGENSVMLQELGGFTSLTASYFAARKHGMEHFFAEPAFYRGRVFFNRNTFAGPDIPPERYQPRRRKL